MLKELHFVTGNTGKFRQLEMLMLASGIKLIQTDLDIIEPQADSVKEIAISKAEQAFKLVGKPIVVEDSGLYIDALHGLPGPYIKYMNTHLSLEQILDIMAGKKNRACHWEMALAYADENGAITTFEDTSETGYLAEEIFPKFLSEKAYSQFWKIYISGDTGKPLAALTEKEYAELIHTQRENSQFNQFSRWITAQQKQVA